MLRIYNRQVDRLEGLLHSELKELPKELKIIDEILLKGFLKVSTTILQRGFPVVFPLQNLLLMTPPL